MSDPLDLAAAREMARKRMIGAPSEKCPCEVCTICRLLLAACEEVERLRAAGTELVGMLLTDSAAPTSRRIMKAINAYSAALSARPPEGGEAGK